MADFRQNLAFAFIYNIAGVPLAARQGRARTMPERSPLRRVMLVLLHGNVGNGAHGNADVGRGQCRSLVNAIAHHGDDLPLAFAALDRCDLIGGQHLRLDAGNLEPACPPAGHRLSIRPARSLRAPSVVAIRPLSGVAENELLRLTASLERMSEHPLGGWSCALPKAAGWRCLPRSTSRRSRAKARRVWSRGRWCSLAVGFTIEQGR